MKSITFALLLAAATGFAQTPKPADPAKPAPTSGNSTLEYTSFAETTRNARQGLLTPGTLYYAPAKTKEGAPRPEPVIGEDAEKKFIEIQGIDGGVITNTTSSLTRCSQIPENPPKTITVSFDARLNKTELSGWEKNAKDRKGHEKEIQTASLFFGTADRLSAPTEVEIPPNKGWVTKSVKLDIPAGAKFLYIQLRAIKGEKLAFANWTIN